jgi:hypothetical protein
MLIVGNHTIIYLISEPVSIIRSPSLAVILRVGYGISS